MAFTFKLETAVGTPVDPPSIRSAVPNWRPGDTRRTVSSSGLAEGISGRRCQSERG